MRSNIQPNQHGVLRGKKNINSLEKKKVDFYHPK